MGLTVNAVHIGDARTLAGQLAPQSIHMIVTSPPYFGLRSYLPADHPDKAAEMGSEQTPDEFVANLVALFAALRPALRDDGTVWLNLGSSYASGDSGANQSRRVRREPACGSDGTGQRDYPTTDSAYRHLCDGCQAVLSHHTTDTPPPHRVSASPSSPTVRDTGHRDSAAASLDASVLAAQASTTTESSPTPPGECLHCDNCGACLTVLRSTSRDARLCARRSAYNGGTARTLRTSVDRRTGTEPSYAASATPPIVQPYYTTFKPKDDLMIPYRVAIALQEDGWYVRSTIVWAKNNPMPESVRDRPTRSHEYLFLLSKGARYYYDAEAIAEPYAPDSIARDKRARLTTYAPPGQSPRAEGERCGNGGRNKRDVWTIATQPYPDAHFATFPPELVRPCIRAGTSERGVCAACGAPWRRVVERGDRMALQERGTHAYNPVKTEQSGLVKSSNLARDGVMPGQGYEYTTTGWSPTCTCDAGVRPAVVLDPFAGSGTVAQVCVEEGRNWLGFDLDERSIGWHEGRLRALPVRSLFAAD